MAILITLVSLMSMLSLSSSVVVKPHLPILDDVRPPIEESTVPHYSYAYDVHDAVTGDFKNHHETREGDVVRGGYSFIEADGSRRIVDYVSDPINGFNAVVRKEPGVAHPTDPVAPKVNLQHPHAVVPAILPKHPSYAHHPVPAVLPKHLPYGHVPQIPAVTIAPPHHFLPLPPPIRVPIPATIPPRHLKLPAVHYPVHPYAIDEPPVSNEIYPHLAPRNFLPIGRYGYALTNAAFPNLQPH